MSLTQLVPRVRQYVRDDTGVLADPRDYDAALKDALLRYSRRRPRRLVRDLVSPGGFDLPLPEEWDAGFSACEQVEYPVGAREPNRLDRREFWVYETPEGQVLRLRSETPAAGVPVRVRITAPHTIDDSTTTVPAADWDILVNLATALACEQLATEYAKTSSSTIIADGVDHGSRSKEFAARAARYLALATKELPELGDKEVRAAGAETSFASELPFLTH